MDPAKYEYQSDFAKRFIKLGRAEGLEEGRAEGEAAGERRGRAALLMKQLARRFETLPDDVRDRLAQASIPELDNIAEHLLTAQTLDEALGTLKSR